MYQLKWITPPEWADQALKDFDHFLLDHASCERKASAVGMSFIVRYPDRKELIDPMIHFSREELEHFHQVYRIIEQRGLTLIPDEEDPYVGQLMKSVRFGREERFLDRLLASSLIEARGAERLALVAEKVPENLRDLYRRLARAEKSHEDLFLKLAYLYFPKSVLEPRLEELLEDEAKTISSLPPRSALH